MTTIPFPGTFPTNSFGNFGGTAFGTPSFGHPSFGTFGFNPSFGWGGSGHNGFGASSYGTPNFGNSFGSWQNTHPWNHGFGYPTFNAYTFGGTPTGFTWSPWTGWTPTWNNSFSPTGYAFPNFGYASSYGPTNYGTPSFNHQVPTSGTPTFGTPNYGTTNYGTPSYGTTNFGSGTSNFSTQNRPYPAYPSYADRTGCCNPARDAA